VKQLGFKVTVLKDASYKAMDSALKRSSRCVEPCPTGSQRPRAQAAAPWGWPISSPSLPPSG